MTLILIVVIYKHILNDMFINKFLLKKDKL
jgi:hypothetical protein